MLLTGNADGEFLVVACRRVLLLAQRQPQGKQGSACVGVGRAPGTPKDGEPPGFAGGWQA